MKKTAKTSAIITTAALVLSLCGCYSQQESSQPSEAENSSVTSSDTGSDINSDTVSDASSDAGSDTSSDAQPVSCQTAADTVMKAIEFPDMIEVTQPEMLENILDFNSYGITSYSVYQQMMSVHLCEVIILKTDDVKAAESALKQRQSDLIEKLSFYPEQQESAAASVVGSKNGYCYLIAHKDAKTAEKALLEIL